MGRRPRSNPAFDTVIACVAALAFLLLAWSVARGGTQEFDRAIRETVHTRASGVLTTAMEGITRLGEAWFIFPFVLLVVVMLRRSGRTNEAVLFAVAVAGAEVVNESLKLIFQRTRPEAFFGYPLPGSYSFPSGHSLVSYCFYLALAEILIEPEWPRARKFLLWLAAGGLVLLIGLSRIYLGVHYPTDVIGGYTAAIAWTAVLRAAHHRWWS